MSIMLSKSNKGWHKLWFYLRNTTDRLIEEASDTWRYGPIGKE